MNKNAIKKYATEARRELISRVSQRALKYGISEKEVGNPNDDSVNGHLLSSTEKKQRAALIEQIQEKGYEQVMEEVAYTWFNRFSALRFMEVNAYLPSRVRVFTDEDNAFKPQILTEAIHLELDGLDMEKIYAYKDANDTDELYKYLLITQCNALNNVLPGMFQKIADYTELLFPDNLLREGSVIQQMIELIPEEDWKDQVQIIGWLYQYYNNEKKNDVFAALKKNVKITKENIPAATQLFTPDWIVRYMVENSLGRLWLEGHPEVKDQLLPTEEEQSAYAAGNRDPEDRKWHYYLEEAKQEPEVENQLAEIRRDYAALTPEQLKVIDPCAGSGHILAYMFDVLIQIYESYGYTTRDAVSSIVEHNLYGLDIDDRAAQLAYFAVMMKARQYDRRFFSRGIQPHVYAIAESNHVDSFAVEYFCKGDVKLTAAMDTILRELHDAKEYGSILTVTPQDWSALYARFAEIEEDIHISREAALRELLPLVQVAEALAQKYDISVTNPPYMGSANMSVKLFDYIKSYYADYKSDLFAAFILRMKQFSKAYGMYALITQQAWMFKSSYRNLRPEIYQNAIVNMLHLGAHAFDELAGEVVQTVTYVQKNWHCMKYLGKYIALDKIESEEKKRDAYLDNPELYFSKTENFMELPNQPTAYWASSKQAECFIKFKALSESGITACAGLNTSDNGRFVRLWQEVDIDKIGFGCSSHEELLNKKKKYALFNKGGGFRKWYGNQYFLIAFDMENFNILATIGNHLPSRQYYFRPCITWNRISSAESFSARMCDSGYAFDDVSPSAFLARDDFNYAIGLMNSKPFCRLLCVMNRGMKTETGNIQKVPYAKNQQIKSRVEKISNHNIDIARNDWDAFEASWNFLRHPLIRKVPTIAEAFEQWKTECDERFNQLKANEEELNRIFIDIYGLQDELTPEVEDKDVTVRKADLGRDIRSFISYAVGCMFGRYSLDVDGIAYAGGEWDSSKYVSFAADKDNIIPICDDEYFADDIVDRFIEFVKTVYGAETLEKNLKFIADALGGKGQPKDMLRNYFLTDFFKDHCNTYQVTGSGKRPIYWLFDSGKKNGFKALIYMHRYQPDTIARIRTDYVHEQQARYRTAIADLEARAASASTSERVKLNKQLKTLNDQATEIHAYEEKIHHLADQMISIDLDDGVKVNYAKFQDVLAKIK